MPLRASHFRVLCGYIHFVKTIYRVIFPLHVICLFCLALPLYASLGGKLTTIESDEQALQGQMAGVGQAKAHIHIQKRIGYNLHEITVNGTQVQEYALPTGTVFAVAWHGTVEPDLSQLLGKYFGEYEHELIQPQRLRSRGPRVMRSKNMIVERSGHMRDLRGRAYLPELLPPGFTPKDIQ